MKPAPKARARIHPAHCRCRACDFAPRSAPTDSRPLAVAFLVCALAGFAALAALV